ncbi:MAG: PIN domain-containing protein [Elainellaceae cyanobacterium]
MSKVVLDASALLALVNQEPGQEVVAEFLPQSLVSAVNVSEFVAKLIDQGMPENEVQDILKALDLTVTLFDSQHGVIAGCLRAMTRHWGLSLGDRAVPSFGIADSLPCSDRRSSLG